VSVTAPAIMTGTARRPLEPADRELTVEKCTN
jgi:hypothetical protein